MLPTDSVPTEYMKDYLDYSELYDCRAMLNHGQRLLLTEDFDELRQLLTVAIYSNMYAIKTLYGTVIQEYSPIENTDRYEDITIEHLGSETNETDVTDTVTKNGSKTNTRNGNIVNTEKVTSFDSDTQSPNNEQTTVYNGLVDTENYTNLTDTTTKNGTDTKRFIDRKDRTITHAHGNIGVTTNQDMLKQERNIAMFNFMDSVMSILISNVCELYYE